MKSLKATLSLLSLVLSLLALASPVQAQSREETEYFIQTTLTKAPFYEHHSDYRYSFKVADGYLEQYYRSSLLLRIRIADIGGLDAGITKLTGKTLAKRCGLDARRYGRGDAKTYRISMKCRNGEKCVQDFWAVRDKMVRKSGWDLLFCPTKAGQRDVKRVHNAIGHYAQLMGVRVNTLDREAIGAQFD